MARAAKSVMPMLLLKNAVPIKALFFPVNAEQVQYRRGHVYDARDLVFYLIVDVPEQ